MCFYLRKGVESKQSPGVKIFFFFKTLFLIVLLGGDYMARTVMEIFGIWRILNLEIQLPLREFFAHHSYFLCIFLIKIKIGWEYNMLGVYIIMS